MTLAATVPLGMRPDEWNFPLFFHILGAMVLVGAVVLAVCSLAAAWNNGSATMLRLSFRSLLWVAFPAWIVMRVAAEGIQDKEKWPDGTTFVDIGYQVADPLLLLLVISIFLAWRGAKRSDGVEGTGRGFDRAATVLMGLSLVGLLVAIYAMTTKPI